jgi:hypothetical protein
MSQQGQQGESGKGGGGKKVGAAIAVVVVVAALLVAAAPIVGLMAGAAATAGIASAFSEMVGTHCPSTDPTITPGGITADSLTADQMSSARTIVSSAVGAIPDVTGTIVDHSAQQRAAVIAIATAMQESHLTDLPGGDLDSVGLFQQRPSMGWGTVAQLTNPTFATDAFLLGSGSNPGLVNIPNWQTMPLTQAAQAVQKSAYPNAYSVWESLATQVVGQVWSTAGSIPVPADLTRQPEDADVRLDVPPAQTECDDTTTSGETAAGGHAPGPWGGFSNGNIPETDPNMCLVTFAPTSMKIVGKAMYLRCDAEHALEALNAAYEADHGGASLKLTDAYRSVQGETTDKALEGDGAAPVGYSNHGWGLAVDVYNCGQKGDFTSPNYLWLKANAAAFGFVHPSYMEPGGSGPFEPWHWEFWPPTTTTPTPEATP